MFKILSVFIAFASVHCEIDSLPEDCITQDSCVVGFVCKSGKCEPNYLPNDKVDPSGLALTSHAVLNQLNSLSNGIFSNLESAAEAVSVSNDQLNFMQHLKNGKKEESSADVLAELQQTMDKFWKRLNDTLKDGSNDFKDFAKKTKTDFNQFQSDIKKKFSNSSSMDSEQKPFNYSQYVPSMSGSGFDWQKFIPKGVPTNNGPATSTVKYDADLEPSSKLQSTGFDWSVYVPSGGSGQGASGAGNFDWSQYVPGSTTGSEETKPKKKHLKGSSNVETESKDDNSKGFDYSQYLPKGIDVKKNQNGDLFADSLSKSHKLLTSALENDGQDFDYASFEKALQDNSKEVSDNAHMVAEEASKLADKLALKLKTTAANLKQAAIELQKKSSNIQKAKSPEVKTDTEAATASIQMGKYFALALGIALIAFGLIACFCNGSRQGYSTIA